MPTRLAFLPAWAGLVFWAACSQEGASLQRYDAPAFDLSQAVSAFPDSLRHWSGKMAPRMRNRMVLFCNRSENREAIGQRLLGAGLELEPDPAPGKRVLHTDAVFWVRSRDGGPLRPDDLREASRRMGEELGWAGAVFRLPEATGSQPQSHDSLALLYCAFPHSLVLGLTSAYLDPARRDEAEAALARRRLAAVSWDHSEGGLIVRWTGTPEANVYRLADSLQILEPGMILDVRYESGPMLFPGQ